MAQGVASLLWQTFLEKKIEALVNTMDKVKKGKRKRKRERKRRKRGASQYDKVKGGFSARIFVYSNLD